ncbi:MAG: hypothetical protein QXZ02_05295 [Candidatus Bathyarchaeia archaeon]
MKQQLQLLCVYGYMASYGRFEAFSVKEAEFKLCYGIFGYTHICIEAVEGDYYHAC